MTEQSDAAIDVLAERRKNLAFNTEAARAGLHAAALDMLDTMKENGVDEAEACVMTAIVEVAAQTWMGVALRQGVLPARARKVLIGELQKFATKHIRLTQATMKNETAQAMLENPAND